jgi:hypothetical protein
VRNLIPRRASACLARRLTGLRDDGGRGAVAVIVTVLIGSGVLLGMAALVVDVGQIYQNRAELQNGADAAALAVAKSCAAGACPASATTYAATYATLNASKLTSSQANVDFVCGVAGVHGGLTVGSGKCPVKKVCPPNPPDGRNYVDVETSTLMPGGSRLLPPVFAGTLAGTHTGSTVYACAQAQWGGPATTSGIALTISACTWDQMTSVGTGTPGTPGTTYAQPPPYPPNSIPPSSLDQVIYLKGDGGGTGSCSTEPNGAAAAGNFGWTDDTGSCQSAIGGSTYGGNPGNSVSKNCKSVLTQIIQNGAQNPAVFNVPIYQKVSLQGQKATYTLQGVDGFVITGFNFPGAKLEMDDWMTHKAPCGSPDSCISGYFVHQIDLIPGGLGNSDLGFDIIKLTG